jgi:Glutamate-1-semialdehyde aminotransferase
LFDEDGNQYIDYINSWGPMILGHAYQPVVDAICAKVADSTSFGAPTELEVQMAELIKEMVPTIDLVRMVNSGTEAA